MPQPIQNKIRRTLDIIDRVVSKQLKDTSVQTERNELVNVAVVAVLEASEKVELTSKAVATIAKRGIINFKLGGRSNALVPLGSRNYLRKCRRLPCDVSIDDRTTTKTEKEVTRVTNLVINAWSKKKVGLQSLVVGKLMEGLTVNKVIQELREDTGIKNLYDKVYNEIVPELAKELRLLGFDKKGGRNK